MANTISVKVLGDVRDINRKMGTVTNQLSGFQKSAGRVGSAVKGLLAGFALTQVVSAVKSVVSAASDAEQSIGATGTVFGKFADTVIRDSNKAATQFGLDANTYRENANLLGSLFSNQGVALKNLAGSTKEMIGIGSDLAATFGGTTTDAVNALGAAFKGEFDQLERYGISIKQSTVNTEAQRLATSKYGKELSDLSTAQQKSIQRQATENLIMKQSGKTRGAFAKETGTLAHQQQVLAAQFNNLKVTLGTALLPIITKAFTFINDNFKPAMERLSPVVDAIKEAFSSMGEALAPVGDWFRKHPEVIKGIAIALGIAAVAAGAFAIAMGAIALVSSPIVLVVAAIAAVGGAIAYAWKNSETFRNTIIAIGESLKQAFNAALPIVQQVAQAIMDKWGEIAPTVMGYFETIKTGITDAMEIIKIVIDTTVAVITDLWSRFGGNILQYVTSTFGNIITFIQGALDIIGGIIKTVLSVLKGDWKGAWQGIKQILSGVWNVMKALVGQALNVIRLVIKNAWTAIKGITGAIWNGIKSAISNAWSNIKNAVSNAINGVKTSVQNGWNNVKTTTTAAWNKVKETISTKISNFMGDIRRIPGMVTSALAGLGSLLVNAGKQLIEGLVNGIESMFGKVKDTLGSLTKKVTEWKGPPKKDKVLLRKAGQVIIKGLINGFKDGRKGVKDALSDVTDQIQAAFNKKYGKGKKAGAATRRVMKGLHDEYVALLKNAKAYEKVQKRLIEARKALDDLKKAAADYGKRVTESILSYGNVTGLNSAFSTDAMIQQLQARLTKVKEYAQMLRDLKNLGLNTAMYDDLVQAGVEGGYATAQAMLNGGQTAIDEFNNLQSELNSIAETMGSETSSTMYQAGIDAAQGLVDGLEKKAKALEKAAKRLANAMVAAIKKALGIKSPSRVFKALGVQTMKGLEIGISDTHRIEQSMKRLSGVMTDSFNPRLATATTASGRAGNTYQITVQAGVGDPAAIGKAVTTYIDAYEKQGGRRSG